jgi:hypothetical protein
MLTTKKGSTAYLLLDEKIPIEHRKRMLAELCLNGDDDATKLIRSVLKAAASTNGKDLYAHKKKELEELLQQLRDAPRRAGLFLDLLPANGSSAIRAHVRLEDGASIFPVVPEEELSAGRGDPRAAPAAKRYR